jgi:hypothetical protein
MIESMIAPLENLGTRYSYHGYVQLTEDLLAREQTTGTNHSPSMIEYTRLNLQRQHRLYKTASLDPALVAAVKGLQGRYNWTVISEAWCGDVAQNLPVIALVAEQNPDIHLEVVLRDENPTLMDAFETDGGRAIPILVVTDADTGAFITRWGPRPAPAQQMVRDYKALETKPPYAEFVKGLQLWYRDDHTRTLQAELLALVQGLY